MNRAYTEGEYGEKPAMGKGYSEHQLRELMEYGLEKNTSVSRMIWNKIQHGLQDYYHCRADMNDGKSIDRVLTYGR